MCRLTHQGSARGRHSKQCRSQRPRWPHRRATESGTTSRRGRGPQGKCRRRRDRSSYPARPRRKASRRSRPARRSSNSFAHHQLTRALSRSPPGRDATRRQQNSAGQHPNDGLYFLEATLLAPQRKACCPKIPDAASVCTRCPTARACWARRSLSSKRPDIAARAARKTATR